MIPAGVVPAGPVDIREVRDVAEGLWLCIDVKSVADLHREADVGAHRCYRLSASCYAVVFEHGGRWWAARASRLPIPKRIQEGLP